MSTRPRILVPGLWESPGGKSAYRLLKGWGDLVLERRETNDPSAVPAAEKTKRSGKTPKAKHLGLPRIVGAAVIHQAAMVETSIASDVRMRELLSYVFVDGWEMRIVEIRYRLFTGTLLRRGPDDPAPGRYRSEEYVHRRVYTYDEGLFLVGPFAALSSDVRINRFKSELDRFIRVLALDHGLGSLEFERKPRDRRSPKAKESERSDAGARADWSD